jgi:hypothetical protein
MIQNLPHSLLSVISREVNRSLPRSVKFTTWNTFLGTAALHVPSMGQKFVYVYVFLMKRPKAQKRRCWLLLYDHQGQV